MSSKGCLMSQLRIGKLAYDPPPEELIQFHPRCPRAGFARVPVPPATSPAPSTIWSARSLRVHSPSWNVC